MLKHGRVLILHDGRRVPYAASGAYADIFIDEPAARVYKLFISNPPEPFPRSLTPEQLNDIRRENFQTQVAAYNIACADPFLAAHVPQFFGTVYVAGVEDATAKSVSGEYLLDACYVVQRVPGRDEKIDPRSDFAPDHIKEFRQRCNTAGIKYLHDCSAFCPDDAQWFVVIDFATRGIEMPW